MTLLYVVYFHERNRTDIISYEALLNMGLIARDQFEDNETPAEVKAALAPEDPTSCKNTQFIDSEGKVACKCPPRVRAEETDEKFMKALEKKIEEYKKRLKSGKESEEKINE